MSDNTCTLECTIANDYVEMIIQWFENGHHIITEENTLKAIKEGSIKILIFMLNNGLEITDKRFETLLKDKCEKN